MRRARRRRIGPRIRSTHVALLLASLVVIGPQLAAGRPPWAIALLCCCAGFLSAATAILGGESAGPSRIGVALAGVAAWTAAQALPLPRSIVASFAPDLVAARDATAATLDEAAARTLPLTYSAVGTEIELLKILAVAATFVVAQHCVRRGARRVLTAAVAISVAGIAFAALLHTAADASTVYGFHHPLVMGRIPSPLINENHLAGFMALGIPVQLALALAARTQAERAGWAICALGGAALAVLTFSRSGLLGLGVGLVCFVALTAHRARAQSQDPVGGRGWLALGALVVVVASVGAAMVALRWSAVREDFAASGLDKVRLALRGMSLAESHPWTGVGRGGYSVAFVELFGTDARYEIPESWPVQWLTEWGVPAALLLLLAVLGDLRRGLRGALESRSTTLAHGAMAALASIGIHDLVDGATEQLGIAIPVVVLLALATTTTESGREPVPAPPRPASPVRRFWQERGLVASAGTAALVATLVLGPGLGERTTQRWVERLTHHLELGETRAALDQARAGMRLHPLEPAFPLLAADAAARLDDARAIRFLNRAMALAPGWFSPHLVASRVLARRGHVGQAWLELRAAERLRAQSSSTLGCQLLTATRRPEVPVSVFASMPDVLDRLAGCAGLPPDVVVPIDDALAESGLVGPTLRSATRELAAGHSAAAIARLEPHHDDPRLRALLVDAYVAAGRPRDAIALFADEPATSEEALALARALTATGDADGMRRELDRVRSFSDGEPGALARSWIAEGDLETALGNDGAALRAFDLSSQIDPGAGGLERTIALAERMGVHEVARRARRALCDHEGPRSTACATF